MRMQRRCLTWTRPCTWALFETLNSNGSSASDRPTLKCSENSSSNTGNTRRYQTPEAPKKRSSKDRGGDIARHVTGTVLRLLPVTEADFRRSLAMCPGCAAVHRVQQTGVNTAPRWAIDQQYRPTDDTIALEVGHGTRCYLQLPINNMYHCPWALETVCSTLMRSRDVFPSLSLRETGQQKQRVRAFCEAWLTVQLCLVPAPSSRLRPKQTVPSVRQHLQAQAHGMAVNAGTRP